MIANATRGRSFRALLEYLLNRKKTPEIVGGNMVGKTARELAREFAAVRGANDRVRTPVFHCSLSLPIGERLGSYQWADGAKMLLDELGLAENRPWIAIRHGDKDHDHVHIATSRTDYLGEVWYGEWEVKRVLKAKALVEERLGLTVTPVTRPEISLSKAQIRQAERLIEQGYDDAELPDLKIVRAIDAAVAASGGDQERFVAELKDRGIAAKLNRSNSSSRVSGASFSCDNGQSWSKGSKLGRAYRWAELAERIEEQKTTNQSHEIIGAKDVANQPIEHRGKVGQSPEPKRTDPGCTSAKASVGLDIAPPPGSPGPLKFPNFAAQPSGLQIERAGGTNCHAHGGAGRLKPSAGPAEGPKAPLVSALIAVARAAIRIIRSISERLEELGPIFSSKGQDFDSPKRDGPIIK